MDKYTGISRAKVNSYHKTYEYTIKQGNYGKNKAANKHKRKQKSGFVFLAVRYILAAAVFSVVYFGKISNVKPLKKASDIIKDELSRKSIISLLDK